MGQIQVQPVANRRDLQAFVKFPWRVYRGDRNWVPPLISERLEYLDPTTGPFYKHADVRLFLARQDREVVGTIAAFVHHLRIERLGGAEGGFGFLETIDDYAVAERLLDTAAVWLRERKMSTMRGPTSFGDFDCPGVLVDGADCPPVMLAAHTPAYYKDFLEQYGMEKDHDWLAWRISCERLGQGLEGLPPAIARVADVARRAANVTVRKLRLEDWDREIAIALHLFNATLEHIPNHIPLTEAEWRRLAGQMKPLLDPDLALFVEVDGEPIGFCAVIPDANRVLIHLNGRLFPLGWLKALYHGRRVDVASFKLMGVLQEYRRRGIDALLYMQVLKTMQEKGYRWLDGSLTSELNPLIDLVARRLGAGLAEIYKRYRVYRVKL